MQFAYSGVTPTGQPIRALHKAAHMLTIPNLRILNFSYILSPKNPFSYQHYRRSQIIKLDDPS